MTFKNQIIYFSGPVYDSKNHQSSPDIPTDLILYLKTCKNNNIIWSLGDTHNAPDIVLLRKIEQLKWINLLVSPFNDEMDIAEIVHKIDPNEEKEGYYELLALDILLASTSYEPDGILVWLPDLNTYGSWDMNHYELTVFPGHTWNDIIASPKQFLESQWLSERERPQEINTGNAFLYFDLWEKCMFKNSD
ncbi:hypothetical protein LEP1GSC105_2703 [Leptospira interrogans str. UI 12758]|uniref:Uncharacterized protein n=2 Tax=Leptospira interrogans TaxID=173 RepID=A0A0E2DD25_LEPIR|nr:hypothetical protein [Leptospira interrogans]EKR53541.1 hypothetical protein LEP1GSC105_2703 [Leptospira interrogans str. UI 12758]